MHPKTPAPWVDYWGPQSQSTEPGAQRQHQALDCTGTSPQCWACPGAGRVAPSGMGMEPWTWWEGVKGKLWSGAGGWRSQQRESALVFLFLLLPSNGGLGACNLITVSKFNYFHLERNYISFTISEGLWQQINVLTEHKLDKHKEINYIIIFSWFLLFIFL